MKLNRLPRTSDAEAMAKVLGRPLTDVERREYGRFVEHLEDVKRICELNVTQLSAIRQAIVRAYGRADAIHGSDLSDVADVEISALSASLHSLEETLRELLERWTPFVGRQVVEAAQEAAVSASATRH